MANSSVLEFLCACEGNLSKMCEAFRKKKKKDEKGLDKRSREAKWFSAGHFIGESFLQ